jgi:hypothetical protein
MTQPINDEFQPPDPALLAEESAAYEPAEPLSRAAEVLERHHDRLMALPGVVMVGESLDPVGRPAILIGVKAAGDLAVLPQAVDGVPVIKEVIGEVDAY